MVRGARSIFGRGKGEAGEEAEAEPVLSEDALEAAAAEPDPDYLYEESTVERRARSGAAIALALLFAALAVGWVAAVAWGLAAALPPSGVTLLRIAAWVGLACGPLALLAVLWLLFQRTGTVEAGRYARAASDLRTESLRLAELLTLLNRRISDARVDLAEQAGALAEAGEEAGGRLAKAGAMLNAEARHVAVAAAALDDATASARTDLGVLLSDLPQAQAKAADLGTRLREAASDANANAEALSERLTAIEAQARGVDQGSVAATRRLSIELERLEGSAVAVDRRIAEATERLEASTASVLDQAAGSLDQVRRTVDEQGQAIAALLGHSDTSFRDIGDEATRALAGRLDSLATRFDAIGGRMRAHESSSRTWLGQLDLALTAIEGRFTALGDHGAEQTADLAEALAMLGDHSSEIGRALANGGQSAETLLARVETLRSTIEGGRVQLSDELPAALSRLRLHTEAGLEVIDRAVPQAEKLARDAEIAAERSLVAGQVMDRHGEATVAVTGQVQALQVLLARIDATFTNIAEGASTRLVDALIRVKETAGQAAAHAQDTLTNIIPQVAGTLADASAEAMSERLRSVGRDEIDKVGAAAGAASDAAQVASDRLNRQLMALAEATQLLETRFAEHRAAMEAENEGSFARQVGLLIEALNSTAIDVGRLLAQEPSDTDWAAYLKGDRGIFTRRVVRLLDNGDARHVAERYREDGAFQDLVNRYVHDFEGMLRRVLSTRDGGMMSVTLLSSDAGKLYVALAQAIERLR